MKLLASNDAEHGLRYLFFTHWLDPASWDSLDAEPRLSVSSNSGEAFTLSEGSHLKT